MKEEHTLDQNKAPIYEALQTFRQMRVVPFDVPGHKRGRGNPELTRFLGEQCVSIDVNSMKPLDNLCHPISVIREAEELAALAEGMDHVRLRGLMAIPPVSPEPGANRPFFAAMRQLFVDIKGKMAHNQDDMDCLSMGMSGDYADAIAEGSTLVRVGTALFGPRPPMTKQ